MSGFSTRKDVPAFVAGFFQTSSAKIEVVHLAQGTVSVLRENIGMEWNISEGRLRQLRAVKAIKAKSWILLLRNDAPVELGGVLELVRV